MTDWVKVAKVQEVPQQGLRVLLGEEEVLLVRASDDVFAIGYLCSHQDMELEGGRLEGFTWGCPHHGAHFDVRTGEALTMPAVDPVNTFEVKVEGGEIFIREPPA